ncbi:MAG: flagellar brake protein [Solirubrobacterales bacterium]
MHFRVTQRTGFIVISALWIIFTMVPVASAQMTQPVFGETLNYNNFSQTLNKGMSGDWSSDVQLGLIMLALMALSAALLLLYKQNRDEKRKKPRKVIEKAPKQTRSYVRVEADIPFQYLIRRDEDVVDAAEFEELEYLPAHAIDISAGGFMFPTNRDFTMGEQMSILMDLPEGPSLEVVGKVVRILDRPDNAGNLFMIGVQFLDIKSRDQEKIVNWIFKYQRESIEAKKTAQTRLCLMCGHEIGEQAAEERSPYCKKCQLLAQ